MLHLLPLSIINFLNDLDIHPKVYLNLLNINTFFDIIPNMKFLKFQIMFSM